jgi:hypothetical protein
MAIKLPDLTWKHVVAIASALLTIGGTGAGVMHEFRQVVVQLEELQHDIDHDQAKTNRLVLLAIMPEDPFGDPEYRKQICRELAELLTEDE